jgi:hypothetical protein
VLSDTVPTLSAAVRRRPRLHSDGRVVKSTNVILRYMAQPSHLPLAVDKRSGVLDAGPPFHFRLRPIAAGHTQEGLYEGT